MRILQRLGCKVTFAPVDNYLFLDRYTTDLQRLGIECLYAPFVTSVEEYLRQHGQRVRPRPDLQVRGRQAAPGGPSGAWRRGPRVVLHTSDLHFLREQREAEVRNDPRMRQRADRMKQEELAIIQQVDCTIVHSTFEQALLAERSPRRARRSSSGGRSTCRGRLRRSRPGATSPSSEATSILRTSMARCSSLARSCRWCSDSCPTYGSTSSAATRPPSFSRCRTSRSGSRGFVPDLGPLLDGMRLSVAPLRYGAGIKGKIGTSLSHGLPCVATPLAVEGMALAPDRDVLVATTPGGVRLGRRAGRTPTPRLWASALGRTAMAFVREHYSLDRRDRAVRRAARLARAESASARGPGSPPRA